METKAVKRVVGVAKAASPPRTEGLTPLDQDRASSVSDEGGTSAASVDAEPNELEETPTRPWRPSVKR